MKKIKYKRIIRYTFLMLIMFLSFYKNFLSDSKEIIGEYQFDSFQDDSEVLVINKLESERNDSSYGLIKDDSPYVSQVGIQGHMFYFLNHFIHIPVTILRMGICVLLAIVLILICYFISKKYNKLLGITFYITFLLSPWIIAFAKNLYWVEFTWFLPGLFGLLLSMDYSKKKIYIPLIGLCIFIKSLCGYEYITSIMLFAIAFFLIDYISLKEKRKDILKTILITGFTCLLGFFLALLIHGVIRGNGDIITGIKEIYEKDVTRRTLNIAGSDMFSYNNELVDSIQASVFSVVKIYFKFTTNIILGIRGELFKMMCFISGVISLYNLKKKEKNAKRDLAMYIVFLAVTLSWIVLGKAHSYIHTHMNFVLWYFGFVQICIYIIVKQALNFIKNIKSQDID